MSKPRAILSDRLYVDEDDLDEDTLRFFSYEFSGKSVNDSQREPDLIVDTFKYNERKGTYGFPRGNMEKLKKFFGHMKWIDRRAVAPHGYQVRFKGELYEDQRRAAIEWIRNGCGILRADTGWGKNVVLSWIVVALQQRAIVFGDNRDLVEQMHDEFRKKTNITKLEKKHGVVLAGTVHEQKIREFFPVVTFTTYQTFLDRWDKNRSFLLQHKNAFGLVWVNECHIVPAPGIAKVFVSLNPRFRGGDTATPERKDGKEVITYDLVGPVTAEGIVESENCEAYIVKTGVNVPSRVSNWNTILNIVTRHEKRNALIINKVRQDVKDGHICLVLTDRIKHARELAEELHFEGIEAVPYYGGFQHNKKNKDLLKTGTIQVLVAVSKMTQKGFNVPILSSLHITCPMNNRPNLKQRAGRVRRVFLECKKCSATFEKRLKRCEKCNGKVKSGKPPPKVVYYADEGNQILYSCTSGCTAALEDFGFDVHSERDEELKNEGKSRGGLSKYGKGADDD